MNFEQMNQGTNTNETGENDTSTSVDELSLLKQRAALLGISHSPNIGIETLRNKINEASKDAEPTKENKTLGGLTQASQVAMSVVDQSVKEAVQKPVENPYISMRNRIRSEALKLVRIRLTNMNPNKSDLPGDLYAVSNKFIGEVRKFIPYDPKFYVNGYHVPQCILDQLQSKKFISFRIVKDPSVPSGERTESILVKEFAIEILPQLTEAELKKLAADQRARNATN